MIKPVINLDDGEDIRSTLEHQGIEDLGYEPNEAGIVIRCRPKFHMSCAGKRPIQRPGPRAHSIATSARWPGSLPRSLALITE